MVPAWAARDPEYGFSPAFVEILSTLTKFSRGKQSHLPAKIAGRKPTQTWYSELIE
jgi:hypothetical protein